jgi:SAM-dependent methyltransferase
MAFDDDYFRTYYRDYYVQNPPAKLQHYLDLLLRYRDGGTLLDIGCSYGLFVAAASRHFRCLGMDVDPGVVAGAAAHAPQGSFVAGALPAIPFRDLDAITAFDVLEHVPDLDATLRELHRALRPGGIVLAVVPVYDGPLGWLVRLLDRDPTHIHKRSREFWLQLAESGFTVVEWQGIFRKLLFGRYYVNLPAGRLRGVAPAIVMVLRKERPRITP